MSLIIKTIKEFCSQGVKTVFFTSEVLADLFGDEDNLSTVVRDVRSAVFNAYGVSKMSNRQVMVIVDEAYLSNTLTALTEAWFQRIPVIIISYNSTDLGSSAYLDRCLEYSCLVEDSSDISSVVSEVLSVHGPSLIKIKEQIQENNEIDYSSVINILDSLAELPDVWIYNSNIVKQGYKNIDAKYKYGVLSKYIGYLNGGKNAILCAPEELLAIDSNVFSLRDFPSSFKLFVKGQDSMIWSRIKDWISKNGISIIESSRFLSDTSMADALMASPFVCYVK